MWCVTQPTTGKHCRQARITELEQDDTGVAQLIPMIAELQSQMAELRQGTIHGAAAVVESPQALSESTNSDRGDTDSVLADERDSDMASPETLRRDRRLMRRAAERLAQLGTDDSEDDSGPDIDRGRRNGKKSGSIMTTTEKVVKRIDWPHFYVKRVVDGRRKNITYGELRLEEFVFGFVAMLRNPRSKFDKELMEAMLQNLMQDTMDYSWANARAFYEFVGIDVESGILRFEDEDRIRDMRFTYARAASGPRREPKEATTRPALLPATPNMRCCMPFQKRECPQMGDHTPFTHACAYCARVRSALCRHPEAECMRKANDSSKNVKPRE